MGGVLPRAQEEEGHILQDEDEGYVMLRQRRDIWERRDRSDKRGAVS